jgi:hypothetical protein
MRPSCDMGTENDIFPRRELFEFRFLIGRIGIEFFIFQYIKTAPFKIPKSNALFNVSKEIISPLAVLIR